MKFWLTFWGLAFIFLFGIMYENGALHPQYLQFIWNAPSFIIVFFPAFLIAWAGTKKGSLNLAFSLVRCKTLSYTQHQKDEAQRSVKILGIIGAYSGLMGTLIGCVLMLQSLDDISTIGPKMSVALLTTLYGGILLTFGFWLEAKIQGLDVTIQTEGPATQQPTATAKTESSGEEAPKAKQKGGSLFLFSAIAFVVLIVCFVGAMMFIGGPEDDEFDRLEEPIEMTRGDKELTIEKEKIVDHRLYNPIFSPPKSYRVLLAHHKNYLKIDLSVAVEDQNALWFLMSREPIIDGVVLNLLLQLTSEDLRTVAGLELLKRELYKKLNGLYTDEFIEASETKDRKPIKKILISKFLLVPVQQSQKALAGGKL